MSIEALPELSPVLPNTSELAELIGQVWDSFIDEPVALEPTSAPGEPGQIEADGRAVASVSITGPWNGHLTIALSQEAAVLVAASLFELEAGEVSISEIADAIGELANVVGGNVKAMLPEPSTLSLPQVVIDAHTVTLYSAVRQTSATVSWREHLIDVTLWQAVQRRLTAV
jgi:chemotaxis protein CheX